MVSSLFDRVEAASPKRTESLPPLKPWREVGWIFKDGEAVAVERQGRHTRIRSTTSSR